MKPALIKVLCTLGASGFVLLACTGSALAFGGCVDSPENPTLLLALLGGAAAGVPWLHRYLKKRLKTSK